MALVVSTCASTTAVGQTRGRTATTTLQAALDRLDARRTQYTEPQIAMLLNVVAAADGGLRGAEPALQPHRQGYETVTGKMPRKWRARATALSKACGAESPPKVGSTVSGDFERQMVAQLMFTVAGIACRRRRSCRKRCSR